MIEGGRSCLDIAQQLHAVEKAIGEAKKTLIRDHLDHCLEETVGPLPQGRAPLDRRVQGNHPVPLSAHALLRRPPAAGRRQRLAVHSQRDPAGRAAWARARPFQDHDGGLHRRHPRHGGAGGSARPGGDASRTPWSSGASRSAASISGAGSMPRRSSPISSSPRPRSSSASRSGCWDAPGTTRSAARSGAAVTTITTTATIMAMAKTSAASTPVTACWRWRSSRPACRRAGAFAAKAGPPGPRRT